MDFGALLNGYHADMTRTVAIGEPGEKKRHLYQTVLTAQLEALKAMGPGKEFSAMDRVARRIIDNAGYRGALAILWATAWGWRSTKVLIWPQEVRAC